MAVLRSIVDYSNANGIDNVSVDSVKSKLTSFGSCYRDPCALFGTTGEGVTEDDIQQKIITLKAMFRLKLSKQINSLTMLFYCLVTLVKQKPGHACQAIK
ncbi:hypothetical protein RvY_11374 [Ramazzottius varieornatus]|uniref:Uncharacterized protein n=1 Tax=Ramazzottius varieornatus TaxID=947166 RepID=A0A1D1VFZ5_RAMVA|nr:hypothetical protein RvY_11374 [Ramazzottius varieornatus]